jgi:hypothetical protein
MGDEMRWQGSIHGIVQFAGGLIQSLNIAAAGVFGKFF